MFRSILISNSAALLLIAGGLAAEGPMSRIGWLSEPLPPPEIGQMLRPGAQVTPQAPRLRPPSRLRRDGAGLITPALAGIAEGIWAESDSAQLSKMLRGLPPPILPAAQSLLERMLLVSATPPRLGTGEDGEFLLARMETLLGWGLVDPTLALAESAASIEPRLVARWMDAALLAGEEQALCEVLGLTRLGRLGEAERIFCLARLGDIGSADAALVAARETGTLSPDMLELLAHFLDPTLAEDNPAPAAAPSPTPLGFRLHEAIGAPLSTNRLPRAFAVADLRDVAGWKAQAEAAERLGRAGALSANRWIGIVSAGRPAASGGVWDRLAAVQAVDRALLTGQPRPLDPLISRAKSEMDSVGLTTLFAELYGARLLLAQPEGVPISSDLFEIILLSDAYEQVAAQAPNGARSSFLAALARGIPATVPAPDPLAEVLQSAWEAPLEPRYHGLVATGRTGEALLDAISRLSDGARSDPRSIRAAITLLRHLGFEDVARRTALQLMILPGPRP